MLVNLLDLRENSYRWRSVLAVIESASLNNEAEGADRIEEDVGVVIDYAERAGVSVREAMLWAEQAGGPVTLYLYDEGDDDERDHGDTA